MRVVRQRMLARYVGWLLAIAAALCTGCPGGETFDLRVYLVPPPDQNPLDGVDVLEMSLDFDSGDALTFYQSPVGESDWPVEGIPPSVESGPAVLSFRGMAFDPADQSNALELADGTAGPVAVDTAQQLNVYFSQRRRFGRVEGELSARRVEPQVAALSGGGALVVGGRVGSYPVDQVSAGIERLVLGPDGHYGFEEVDANYHRLGAAVHRVDRDASSLDGQVLLIGGWQDAVEGEEMVNVVDAYDPASGTVGAAFNLPLRMASPELATLEDGRLLLSGGVQWQSDAEVPGGDYVLIDLLAGQATLAGQLYLARYLHRSVQLSDGAVLVCGGVRAAAFDQEESTDECEVWTPGGVDSDVGMALGEPRSEFALHRIPGDPQGRVVAFGGCQVDGDGASSVADTAEVYDPASRTWESLEVRMAEPRCAFGTQLLPDGRFLVCGGVDADGTPLESCELFDPAIEAFVPLPDVSIPGGRTGFGFVSLANELVLLVGGDGTDAEDAFLFNP